jgi:hypothetical protein
LAISLWLLLRFALPKPDWVEIGKLSDYPPADEPYQINDPEYVFLLNDGWTILVLDPSNRLPGSYPVGWNTIEKIFIDPSRGSWFNKYGLPIRRVSVNAIVEQQSLPRYPVNISGGVILFDRSRSEVIKLSNAIL